MKKGFAIIAAFTLGLALLIGGCAPTAEEGVKISFAPDVGSAAPEVSSVVPGDGAAQTENAGPGGEAGRITESDIADAREGLVLFLEDAIHLELLDGQLDQFTESQQELGLASLECLRQVSAHSSYVIDDSLTQILSEDEVSFGIKITAPDVAADSYSFFYQALSALTQDEKTRLSEAIGQEAAVLTTTLLTVLCTSAARLLPDCDLRMTEVDCTATMECTGFQGIVLSADYTGEWYPTSEDHHAVAQIIQGDFLAKLMEFFAYYAEASAAG